MIIDSGCSCNISVGLNNINVLNQLEMGVAKGTGVDLPIVDTREVTLANVLVNNFNNAFFSAGPTPDDSQAILFHNCKVRMRLVRRTQFRQYVLAEWIGDGSSGASSCSAHLPAGDPFWTPVPLGGEQVEELANAVAALRRSLAVVPDLSDGQTSVSLAKALILAVSAKTIEVDAVESIVRRISDGDPNTFDIRCPFSAVAICHAGSARLDVFVTDVATGERRYALSGVALSAGDRVAVQLPLRLGALVPERGGIRQHEVSFALSAAVAAKSTFGIYAGIGRSVRAIQERTVRLVAPDPVAAAFVFRTTDSLA
jgi:hypothetical protein